MWSVAADSGGHDPETGRFLPGNPGRPKGVRPRLTEEFLRALADDFAEHGAAVIAQVRQNDPAQYLRMIASLIPKGLNLADADGSPIVINITGDDARLL